LYRKIPLIDMTSFPYFNGKGEGERGETRALETDYGVFVNIPKE
jgi:hypothetical protein